MSTRITVIPGDGIGPDIANPTPLMLAAAMMLDYLDLTEQAARLRTAVQRVIGAGRVLTRHLGGSASTGEYARAVIAALESAS